MTPTQLPAPEELDDDELAVVLEAITGSTGGIPRAGDLAAKMDLMHHNKTVQANRQARLARRAARKSRGFKSKKPRRRS